MRSMRVQQGYVKFWRLGTVEFGEQSRWSRAPRSRGLWAFPYPYFELSFASHKYQDLMPKRLRQEAMENPWDVDAQNERTKWIETVGRKVLPIREFWYQGDVFTHFLPSGEIGFTGLSFPEETDWTAMDATRMVKNIVSTGTNLAFDPVNGHGKSQLVRTSSNHLEVFIAPGMGRIRESSPKRK